MSSSFARALVLAASTAKLAAAAADRSTWQQEANITSITTECTSYDYPPVDAISASFPAIWGTADLSHAGALASDKALFTQMNGSIPKIAPRGTTAGDFTGVIYDADADPDCWWTATICTTPKLAGLDPDISNCPEPNTWGFTLDDGPNCSHNAYYDYLQSIEQKATLFYIGSNVIDLPLEAQRGLADGHEICAHTWSHPYMTSLTNEQAFAELYYSKKIIREVMGVTVTCWRPPYGDVDDRIRYIAKQLGMTTIIWKHDTFDGSYPTVTQAEIYQNYQDLIDQGLNGTYDTQGIIVLTHEIQLETMQFSQHFLPQIQKAFPGGVMPVGACQNTSIIYGEGSAYQYPNYAEYVAGTRSIQLAAPTAAGASATLATGVAVTSAGLPAGAASSAVTTKSGAKSAASSSHKGTASSAAHTASASASSTASSGGGVSARLSGATVGGAVGLAALAFAVV